MSFLFDPVPAYSLTFLRIFWGLVMAYEVSTFMRYEYSKTYVQLVQPRFMFKYCGFEWIPRLSFEAWKVYLWVMMGLCGCFTVGLFYHFAAVAYFLMFTALYLTDMTFYLNHFYLIICLCATLAVMPANRHFSLDALLFPSRVKPSMYVPRWTIDLMRFMIAVVYVHAGIAKMNEDWIRGEPLNHWVPSRCRKSSTAMCEILLHPLVPLAMSWAGLLWDTFAPVFLYAKGNLRWLGFAASTFFHVSNKLVFNIGVFPWVMLTITMTFFEPDWPISLGEALGFLSRKARQAWPEAPRPHRGPYTLRQLAVLAMMLSWGAFHTFYPLRHYMYPGDVTWNEMGHRYSWRMKLRDKAGMTKFFVTVRHGEEAEDVETFLAPLDKLLNGRQIRKMAGRPELIHLTADYIADVVQERAGVRPEVRAVVVASVNFRQPQYMVNATVDLAAIEPWTWPNDWVVELLPRDVDSSHAMVPRNPREARSTGKNRLFEAYDHIDLAEALVAFEPYVDRAARTAANAFTGKTAT
jgi:hypothetical protein